MIIRSISRVTLPLLCLAGAAAAQDSVSKVNLPLPGDAVEPWDASEQRNDYVVEGQTTILNLSNILESFGGMLNEGDADPTE